MYQYFHLFILYPALTPPLLKACNTQKKRVISGLTNDFFLICYRVTILNGKGNKILITKTKPYRKMLRCYQHRVYFFRARVRTRDLTR